MPVMNYITAREAAQTLRTTTRTVYDYLKDRRLKGYKAAGHWLIHCDDLQAFINNNSR